MFVQYEADIYIISSNVTCSRHDIAEKLLPNNTHYLIHVMDFDFTDKFVHDKRCCGDILKLYHYCFKMYETENSSSYKHKYLTPDLQKR